MGPTLAELFNKIRRIQIQTSHLVDDLLAGAYRSAFKGQGIEFEEVREYQSGDEIRSIDWNVTARMGKPFVKNFREERELTVMLVVDISSSTLFGSQHQTKKDFIAELGALFAFSAIRNNDKIGLILFSDHVEKYLAPKKGNRHVLRLIRELLSAEATGRKTDPRAALSFLGKVQKGSGVCFLISDLLFQECFLELDLISRRQDLISIGVMDPYELAYPQMGLAVIEDFETGEKRVVDTSDPNIQSHFKALAEQRLENHKKTMSKVGGGFISLRTDQPYFPAIRHFFSLRGKRRR